MKPRYRRINPRKATRAKAIQRAVALSQFRRDSRQVLYGTLRLMNGGIVPCFVCGEHVDICVATLEHIVPLSKGGRDEMANYAISHPACNSAKGDMLPAHIAAACGLDWEMNGPTPKVEAK